jgi:hypothetical protein
MGVDRRGFLGIFGASAALVGADGKVTEEHAVEPVAPLYVPRLPANSFDVQDGRLYSALVVRGKDYVFYEGPERGEGSLKDAHRFFHYALGSSNPYVTPWLRTGHVLSSETNLSQAHRLDAPESFLVKRIGVVFAPTSDTTIRNRLIADYTLTFWMGCKYYFRRPLSEIFQVSEFDPALPVMGLVELTLPLLLANQISFYADITGRSFKWGDGEVKMWAVLDGLHARGVQ